MLGLKHLTFRAFTGAWGPKYRMFCVGYATEDNSSLSNALFGFEFHTEADYGNVWYGGFKLTRFDLFYKRWDFSPKAVPHPYRPRTERDIWARQARLNLPGPEDRGDIVG